MIEIQKTNLFDTSRNRIIPIEIYVNNKTLNAKSHLKHPVIINHGYTIKNSEYRFIAEALAEEGYFVISIQHDLDTDPVRVRAGTLYEWGKPAWDRGVANILYVIKNMKEKQPGPDFNKVILIGHSYGGEMAMLFTHQFPQYVAKTITLDNLRLPFPQTEKVPILYLQAKDTKADPGVLPSLEEQKKPNVTLILLNIKHMDMCDRGPLSTHQEINNYIIKFLNNS
ncbi:serine aminopeptidase domain-containing protein [Legionella maioricensis]|uniref:Alpha/beta hydrolase n=1 Tax=Legionella maioricensis TaxID=2896528 RepID=A0A9X2D365_9GAMM|nr:alpha/beta hydrolase [Legionella maioricensis]MCL9685646.1 alpha/beta hydrolase [Legionella maioricensis]MCL9689055.1 alpha/beta hydrolase [Legionella maioricensis]